MARSLPSLITHYKKTTGLFIFIGLLILVLPFAIQFGIQKAFLSQGADEVQLEDVDFNPFSGQLVIKNLQVVQNLDRVLSVQKMFVKIRWRALWQQHLLLNTLNIQHAKLQITQLDPQRLKFAGIEVPLNPQQSEDKGQAPLFMLGIGALTVEDFSVTLLRPNQNVERTTYTLNHLALDNLYMWDKNPAQLIFNSHLNDSRIASHFRLFLFSEHPKVVGTVKIDGLNLAQLPVVAELSELNAEGLLSTDLTFTAQLFPQGLNFQQQGDIQLKAVALSTATQQASWQGFNWSGSMSYIEGHTYPELALNGTAKMQNLQLDDSASQMHLQQSMNAQWELIGQLKPEGIQLEHKGRTTLNGFVLDLPNQHASADQVQWQGSVNFTQADTPEMSASGLMTLQAGALDDSQSQLHLKQNAEAQVDMQLQLHPEGIQLAQTGGLKISDFNASLPKFQIQLQSLNWQGDLALKQTDSLKIDSQGQLKLKTLQTHQKTDTKGRTRPLAEIADLSIDTIAVQQPELIKLKTLSLDGLNIAKQENGAFVTLNQAQVDHITLQDLSKLTLGSLKLSDSQTQITLNKEGKIEQLTALLEGFTSPDQATEPTQNKTGQQTGQASTEQTPGFQVQWKTIEMLGNNQIDFSSHQFASPIQKTITVQTLKIGSLNSQKPAADTPYELKLKLDEFAHFNSRGSLQPFNPQLTAQLSSQLEGLNLVEISPASAQFTGYDISSGQLSADMETKITANKIDAENTLRLHKLKLKAADTSKSAEFEQGLSMPIDAALSLLRDKQDNIKLKLPIQGDLTNPEFDLNDVINTALSGAIKTASKTYLLLALQPFGAIALAGDFLSGQMQAVKLQSIDFEAGQTELSPTMQTYLQKIHALLQERKGVQIKVCGLANEADRNALLKALAQQSKQKSQQNAEKAAAKGVKELVSDTQLLELAQQRASTIKRYLLNQGSSTSQVILCQPKLSGKTDSPKVEMGI